MARGKIPWSKILKKKSNLQFFLAKGEPVGNKCPLNPIVSLDLGDFFSYKKYGHLMGWSTPVDLGHDVLNLGYDALVKNKRVRRRRSRQIPRQICCGDVIGLQSLG
jgi:hypothetical protein